MQYVHTYIHTYIHTPIHTYIYTYTIHAYIHTYTVIIRLLHTQIRIYIHTYQHDALRGLLMELYHHRMLGPPILINGVIVLSASSSIFGRWWSVETIVEHCCAHQHVQTQTLDVPSRVNDSSHIHGNKVNSSTIDSGHRLGLTQTKAS